MTRFIHDQFAKDYLEQLLTPYGEVQAPRRVAGEVRQIDVYFIPKPQPSNIPETLGLLGQIVTTPSLLEPFRNAASATEICDCLLKLLEVRGDLQRQANRNKTRILESDLPKLWILTPTASTQLLSGFGANPKDDYLPGIYFMAEYLRTATVTIHQLPSISETLWLRIIGRGNVQKQAIDELEALTPDNPFRKAALELLYNLQQNLQVTQNQDEEDRELLMRLAPLYQQDREQAIQEGEQRGLQTGLQTGIQQGERLVVENLLKVRFGEIDNELQAIIEPLLSLPPEEFTPLLLQLSREELIHRFC
ncbi:hypothetical protein [Nostoc sp. 'Peltigera malacea cyanobiont' DB3992]|uniref:hypothetical protein n=1 Tax=Nostoc sp. 'Peltigera malacea cyanobiont' DB3992 TaxID=1206980 RepID=UPI000C04F034|nr:hypothetical protein [Nostoc sp. 'Peltigera malacea cyanobiont' DB3992]PHM07998.1 hypothetical protein CK516_23470 [Nostoc sp. 'Peltigera malacea cyanobiont' DB3992]